MIISEEIVKAYAKEMKNIILDKKFNYDYGEIAEVCLHLSNNWRSPDEMDELLYNLVDEALPLASGKGNLGEFMNALYDIIDYGEVDLGVEE